MIKRIKELINILNEARYEYEQNNNEIISNYEYDKLYDELENLEKISNIILPNSPTQNIGYEVVSNLPKQQHSSRILSLGKTKDKDELKSFLGDNEGVLSWKLDGLTIVCTYVNGELKEAVTRGNGEIGELITPNAKQFVNLPIKIPYKEKLVIRGEALIYYSDFEKINENIDVDKKYKNPRNLASGTVRQLNSKIVKQRNVRLSVFSVIDGLNEIKYNYDRLEKLKEFGFEIVEQIKVNKLNLEDTINYFSNNISNQKFASDGLVLLFNDRDYCEKLGEKTKVPNYAMAFKWKDETAITKLINVEWNTSRTGLINPIAIFEPVDLEGTEVERASLHNVSILKDLKLGIGDELEVYKANMIIPQVLKNNTQSNTLLIPDKCPVCQHKTVIKKLSDAETLYCTNDYCKAKLIQKISHFVSKEQMNIDGFSDATIEKFINLGIITNFSSIYKIYTFKNLILKLDGFGNKSFNKLIDSIEKSKNIKLPNLIFALGIPNVGLNTAKLICDYFNNDINKIINSSKEELVSIQGIGSVIAEDIFNYFKDEDKLNDLNDLLKIVNLQKDEQIFISSNVLNNKIFMITGKLEYYSNRKELEQVIISNGGIIGKKVDKNTSYLINNDNLSSSSKNKKAKELNIPIITELEFIEMIK